MQVELKNLQRRLGITFIFVTHDQEEAMTMSDRVAVMNGGRVEQVGPASMVFERPSTEFVARSWARPILFRPIPSGCPRGAFIYVIRPEKLRLSFVPRRAAIVLSAFRLLSNNESIRD